MCTAAGPTAPAWDLQDNPLLLAERGNLGSPTVRRLILALRKHGIDVTAPCCPFCGHTRRLESLRDGQPCCHSCYQDTRRTSCTRCDRELPIAARTVDGDPAVLGVPSRRVQSRNLRRMRWCKPIGTRRGQLRPHALTPSHDAARPVLPCEMTRPCYFPVQHATLPQLHTPSESHSVLQAQPGSTRQHPRRNRRTAVQQLLSTPP